jgi:hypothetical protein
MKKILLIVLLANIVGQANAQTELRGITLIIRMKQLHCPFQLHLTIISTIIKLRAGYF